MLSKFEIRSMGTIEDILWASGIAYDKESTKSIKQLRNGSHYHESPFRFYNIVGELQVPMFVWRQIQRHKVGMEFVEISRRYTKPDKKDFYIENKYQREIVAHTLEMYNNMINLGVKPENARTILPMNIYTKVRMSFTLSWLIRVYEDRVLNPHAQRETRLVVADIIQTCVNTDTSLSEVFKDYII